MAVTLIIGHGSCSPRWAEPIADWLIQIVETSGLDGSRHSDRRSAGPLPLALRKRAQGHAGPTQTYLVRALLVDRDACGGETRDSWMHARHSCRSEDRPPGSHDAKVGAKGSRGPSGAYRVSDQVPDYPDVAPLARALIAANEDRIVWGTDWPHPGHGKLRPLSRNRFDRFNGLPCFRQALHRIPDSRTPCSGR